MLTNLPFLRAILSWGLILSGATVVLESLLATCSWFALNNSGIIFPFFIILMYWQYLWLFIFVVMAVFLWWRMHQSRLGILYYSRPHWIFQIPGLLILSYIAFFQIQIWWEGPYSPTHRCALTTLMDGDKKVNPIIKVSPDGMRIAEVNYETCGVAGEGLNVYLDLYHKSDKENNKPRARVLDFQDIGAIDIKWLDNKELEIDLPLEGGSGRNSYVSGMNEGGKIFIDSLAQQFEEIKLIYKPIDKETASWSHVLIP